MAHPSHNISQPTMIGTFPAVPDGLVPSIGPHGEHFIVPEFLIPATHQAFAAYHKRADLDARDEAGGSGNAYGLPRVKLAGGTVVVPSDPIITHRELMGLHAEIMSLRETLGISYKDASHRLYLAECEKLKTEERAKKALSILTMRTSDALYGFQTMLDHLAHRGDRNAEAEAVAGSSRLGHA